MTICAVICELNPFHNGHEYLLREAKRLTEADYIVAIMSGDYVQRGLPAICDKYTRTRMALLGGADLVIELPVIYATASAEYFANGSVSLIDSLKCVDFLCFGSECGDINSLNRYVQKYIQHGREAHIISGNKYRDDFEQQVAEYLKNGDSYVKAYSKVLGYTLGSNDMLAINYIKSLMLMDSPIEAIAVRRRGSSYLDDSNEADSATAIRKKIKSGAYIEDKVPEYSYKCLEEAKYENYPIELNDFSVQLYTRIDTILKNEKRGMDRLTNYMDVSMNLEGRIKSNIGDFISYEDFVEKIHSKEYTKSRVQRALLHILLDIRKDDYESEALKCNALYARILGFRQKSTELISVIKENAIIPVVSKAREASRLLDDEALKCFEQDIMAANMYEQCCSFKFSSEPVHDFSKEIVIIK